ncbi:hypothetical protein HOLleu_02226 [Holothuria leucospilota]|uniref:Uncharacterized protein n=1 Tax=Holothuria leucospilota TaxID=206669 RepID=A0A9Q1CR01_HOLLE|nr:hypothetical protein HOLleu_02226 [Holothuria leucospilota]
MAHLVGKDDRTNKKSVSYTSIVPISSLILWDFKMAQGRRLRQETVRELKAKYEELDSNTYIYLWVIFTCDCCKQ